MNFGLGLMIGKQAQWLAQAGHKAVAAVVHAADPHAGVVE